MIHLIYIYIIINALLTGYMIGEDGGFDFKSVKQYVGGIILLLIILPLLILQYAWDVVILLDNKLQIMFWMNVLFNKHYLEFTQERVAILKQQVENLKNKSNRNIFENYNLFCGQYLEKHIRIIEPK